MAQTGPPEKLIENVFGAYSLPKSRKKKHRVFSIYFILFFFCKKGKKKQPRSCKHNRHGEGGRIFFS